MIPIYYVTSANQLFLFLFKTCKCGVMLGNLEVKMWYLVISIQRSSILLVNELAVLLRMVSSFKKCHLYSVADLRATKLVLPTKNWILGPFCFWIKLTAFCTKFLFSGWQLLRFFFFFFFTFIFPLCPWSHIHAIYLLVSQFKQSLPFLFSLLCIAFTKIIIIMPDTGLDVIV